MNLAVGLGSKSFIADLTLKGLDLQMNKLVVTLEVALPSESRTSRAKGTDKNLGCLRLPVRIVGLDNAGARSSAQRPTAVA